ncbi:MAG: hypothetical protein R2726_12805 [Acidimicrobiales bacterium]
MKSRSSTTTFPFTWLMPAALTDVASSSSALSGSPLGSTAPGKPTVA